MPDRFVRLTPATPALPPAHAPDVAPAPLDSPNHDRSSGPPAAILVVDDEPQVRKLVAVTLQRAGYDVATAEDGEQALTRIRESVPDLVLSDVMMPRMDGFGLVSRLRTDPRTRALPLIFLTAKGEADDLVTGLGLGADDYVPKPFDSAVLLARVRAKLDRPPVPSGDLPHDRQTGLLSEPRFRDELAREVARAQRSGAPGALATVRLEELPRLAERFGRRAEGELARQLAARLLDQAGPLDVIGRDADGHFLILMPDAAPDAARRRLEKLSAALADQGYSAAGELVRLTPAIGFAPFGGPRRDTSAPDAPQLVQRALAALHHARGHLDLTPSLYQPAMGAAWHAAGQRDRAARPSRWAILVRRFRLPAQIVVVHVLALGLPFLLYAALAARGLDVTPVMYIVVVAALLLTALLIWIEGFCSLRRVDPPDPPPSPYPPASAIIAAYLPNEAATIVETVEAFLRLEYPADLQIILAYNSPRALPVEAILQDIAARDSRFRALRVEGSTSKAQNVNAALAEVHGEFVGVFDADHHPQPDSFTRAWRWLASGYDVVQGHCLVRNGDQSWVARLIAVEFEAIYAVSHPGRARLHDFGIFGGSNGFWRTDLLYETRMRGFMLTEDIDSSMRVTKAGHKIASDPYLISRELGPVTLKALWNQRMRWAQGWFQVSLKHLWLGFWSPRLSLRQKLGLFHLLGWRELYPWLSMQMVPIIAFWAWQRGGLDRIDWLVPAFVMTTLFTLGTGPGQTYFAYRNAAPDIRRHRRWFFFYLVMSSLFYTGFKNLIAVVAQVNELMGNTEWKVTPRASAPPARQGIA